MKRIEKILILLLVLPLLGAALRPLDLKLNGNLLEAPLMESEGEFFMPIKAFSQLSSMQLTERSGGDVILFRDNIFIRFNLNSNIYYLNGKEHTWKIPPFKEKGEIYVPHRIILDYMNYHFKLSQDEIAITGGAYDISLSYQQNRQRVDFVDAKISYTLPYFWQRQSPNSFYQPESQMGIEVRVYPLEDRKLEDIVAEKLREKELQDFKALDARSFHVEGEKILNQAFSKKEKEEARSYYHSYSYLILEGRLVESFFQAYTDSVKSAMDLEEEILKSTQFNAYTIDEMEEHYVELGAFQAMNMNLELPLYSNMLVGNDLLIKGTTHPSLDRIRATVKRGKRSFTYTFLVEEGAFKARIPIPFGLGFHSITLSMVLPEDQEIEGDLLSFYEDEHVLLKFSVLNSSLSEGLFLSYSDQVPSQDNYVGELSSLVGHLGYDFEKAQALLEILKESFELGVNREAQQALEERKISRRTAALIYGALLRRAGVPTRIISNKSQSLFGVEILSNGVWHKLDPYGYMLEDKPALNFMSLPKDYFGPGYINHDI